MGGELRWPGKGGGSHGESFELSKWGMAVEVPEWRPGKGGKRGESTRCREVCRKPPQTNPSYLTTPGPSGWRGLAMNSVNTVSTCLNTQNARGERRSSDADPGVGIRPSGGETGPQEKPRPCSLPERPAGVRGAAVPCHAEWSTQVSEGSHDLNALHRPYL